MTVTSVGKYEFEHMDGADKFAAPLLYVGWDDHKMFCAPYCLSLPSTTKFGEMIAGVFPGLFGAHPDYANIDWEQVQWFNSGVPFKPDMNKTLVENGLGHKSVVRLKTPGLTGLQGSGF